MSNLRVDKFLQALAHEPNATDETKKLYIEHVQRQRSARIKNRDIYEQDKEALHHIFEYRMQMEDITECAKDEFFIKAARIIISLIDNSLESTRCGSGDASSLDLVLSAFEVIEYASISGAMKTTEAATRAEDFILRQAIAEKRFTVISQCEKTVEIKIETDTKNDVFNIPTWYYENLLEDEKHKNRGKPPLLSRDDRKTIAKTMEMAYITESARRRKSPRGKAIDAACNLYEEKYNAEKIPANKTLENWWIEFYPDRKNLRGKARGKSKK